MTVVQDLGFGWYKLQQFKEPDSAIVESSADLMRADKSPSAEDRKEAKLQLEAVWTLHSNTEYEVEAVTCERDVLTKDTKEYQVKWRNYSENSWEPADSFDSKSKPLQEYKKRKKAQACTAAAVTMLTIDMLASQAESLIQDICAQAGIKESDILFVYAGARVPCESYSIAGRTNKDCDLHKTVHGYNYRLTDADRSPCCKPEAGCPYAEKARLHDALVRHVIEARRAGHQRGNKFDYGIENPDGDLKHRLFMQTENWRAELPMAYKPFGSCAFKHEAKTPMSFWTSMHKYSPTGTTGNGRCSNGECKQGEVNAETNMFNHFNDKNCKAPGRWFSRRGSFKEQERNGTDVDRRVPTPCNEPVT